MNIEKIREIEKKFLQKKEKNFDLTQAIGRINLNFAITEELKRQNKIAEINIANKKLKNKVLKNLKERIKLSVSEEEHKKVSDEIHFLEMEIECIGNDIFFEAIKNYKETHAKALIEKLIHIFCRNSGESPVCKGNSGDGYRGNFYDFLIALKNAGESRLGKLMDETIGDYGNEIVKNYLNSENTHLIRNIDNHTGHVKNNL